MSNNDSSVKPTPGVAGEGRVWVTGDGLQPGDAYMEGPYVVFTEQYHLRRGYCCNSGCRHCPYK